MTRHGRSVVYDISRVNIAKLFKNLIQNNRVRKTNFRRVGFRTPDAHPINHHHAVRIIIIVS